jgi:hypothetical protein
MHFAAAALKSDLRILAVACVNEQLWREQSGRRRKCSEDACSAGDSDRHCHVDVYASHAKARCRISHTQGDLDRTCVESATECKPGHLAIIKAHTRSNIMSMVCGWTNVDIP